MEPIINIEPWIDGEELKQLQRVTDSTFVSEHNLTTEFECEMKALTSSPEAVALTNGTAALFCALKSLGIGPGDEVIVPSLTFIASSNAVLFCGAKVVVCDIDPNTLCMCPKSVRECITANTKALMPVHLYGNSCDMPTILHIAKEYNLKIIEDAAQGVGVTFNNQHVGTFGDAGVLSFYANKTMTCGEGGVILSKSPDLIKRCYQLKNHGRLTKGTFKHESIGFNFCFTEMQAAIGISQSKKLPTIIKKKKEIYERYTELLKDVPLKKIHISPKVSPVYWYSSFLTSQREDLVKYLNERNIPTREFFYPIHLQPCYNKHNKVITYSKLAHSEKAFSQGISLPSSIFLSAVQQDYICKHIINFFK